MKSSLLKAVQILALNSVENPTWEDLYDKVCRWYSKTFFTPLADVAKLPRFKVMKIWYQEQYESLYESSDKDKRQEYQELRERLLYADEIEQAELSDDAWEMEMAEEVRKGLDAHENQKEKQDLTANPLTMDEPNLLAEQGNLLFEDNIPEF